MSSGPAALLIFTLTLTWMVGVIAPLALEESLQLAALLRDQSDC